MVENYQCFPSDLDHSYKRCTKFISIPPVVLSSTGFGVVLHLNGTEHQYLINSAEKLKYFLESAEHYGLFPLFRESQGPLQACVHSRSHAKVPEEISTSSHPNRYPTTI